jgi:cell division protease FtsH
VNQLGRHREQLAKLAHALLERETLDEDAAYAAAGISRDSARGAVTRGEMPGIQPAPGLPPAGGPQPDAEPGDQLPIAAAPD